MNVIANDIRNETVNVKCAIQSRRDDMIIDDY